MSGIKNILAFLNTNLDQNQDWSKDFTVPFHFLSLLKFVKATQAFLDTVSNYKSISSNVLSDVAMVPVLCSSNKR